METVLLFLCVAQLTAGFLLNNKACPVTAPDPCVCDRSKVSCQGKSLTYVPPFRIEVNSVFTRSMSIILSENKLTYIPKDAFQDFAVINNTVYIDLQTNDIDDIDINAFSGIEDKIHRLQLSNNKLTTLPSVLLKLKHLEILRIRDNPITHLDASMMYALLPTFNQIELSLDHFKSWPTEIGMVEDLGGLELHGVHFSSLPHNPFGNLVHTLFVLFINGSELHHIPRDICYFHKLWKLRVTNSSSLGKNSDILETCNTPNLILREVELVDNNLNQFPNILASFPSIEQLILNNNNISYIDSDTIPSNDSKLVLLDLAHNNIRRIPFALNKMTKLIAVDMSFNDITSIEENDLQGATDLININLSNNPVVYISRTSFVNNRKLTQLDLLNTELISVPEAIMHFSTGLYVTLTGSQVTCDCHMSSYLQNTTVQITGQCYNQMNITINNYIRQSLPHCSKET